jgi:hypothetical protein
MSLTSFVAIPEVKQRLSREFELPAIECSCPLRVQSSATKYGLVGTAFDYLLRFCETTKPVPNKLKIIAREFLENFAPLSLLEY